MLRSARAVITDDDATVALLEQYLRVDPARVRVVPLGVDAPDTTGAGRSQPPVSFLRGKPSAAQRPATLIAAWAALPASVTLSTSW